MCVFGMASENVIDGTDFCVLGSIYTDTIFDTLVSNGRGLVENRVNVHSSVERRARINLLSKITFPVDRIIAQRKSLETIARRLCAHNRREKMRTER